MPSFTLRPKGPFSLLESADFFAGFTPASGTTASREDRLSLAFRLDGTFEAVGVALRPSGLLIVGDVVGTRDVERARAQVARLLSLDVDARPWAELGERDPVLGRLQKSRPGFRPVCFASPWEALVWGLLAHRVPMRRAAALRRRIAEAHGETVSIAGERIPVFPAPATLVELDTIEGLPDAKLVRLHAAARAAMRGDLDVETLLAIPYDEAVERLRELPGVGAWTASHVVVRGCATPDILPLDEPRVHAAVAHAYGLARPPTDAAVEKLAEAWRPFRTWAVILLVLNLARTGEWRVKGRRGGRRRITPTRTPRRRRGRRSFRSRDRFRRRARGPSSPPGRP